MPEQCDNCVFSKEHGSSMRRKNYFTCHERSPQAVELSQHVNDGTVKWGWPEVYANDWCGKYKQRLE